MHYVDEGEGSPILLLHGEPTWSFLYRKMIPGLTGSGRVVAPDLHRLRPLGQGDRDRMVHVRPSCRLRETASSRNSTSATSRSWSRIWGGPIGLRLAVEDEDRFSRLVILNTAVFRPRPGKPPNQAFLAWREFAEKNPDLPVGLILQGATATDLTEAVIAGYEAPFVTPASKAGVAAVPADRPHVGRRSGGRGDGRDLRGAHEVEQADSGGVLGLRSTVQPQGGGEPCRNGSREPAFAVVEGASHFLQEDKGEAIADLVRSFVKEV